MQPAIVFPDVLLVVLGALVDPQANLFDFAG
jgi:hypothetical protein